MKKRWMFTFLLGMGIGIVAANLLLETYKDEIIILSTYLLEKYPILQVDHARLFQYCIKIRVMPILYIGLFSLTILGTYYAAGYLLWLGFSFGALLSAATIRFGIMGIFLCVTGTFPQFLIYVPVTLAALYFGRKINRLLYFEYDAAMHAMTSRRIILLRYLLTFFLLFIVSISGAALESYVNPIILKRFLKIF